MNNIRLSPSHSPLQSEKWGECSFGSNNEERGEEIASKNKDNVAFDSKLGDECLNSSSEDVEGSEEKAFSNSALIEIPPSSLGLVRVIDWVGLYANFQPMRVSRNTEVSREGQHHCSKHWETKERVKSQTQVVDWRHVWYSYIWGSIKQVSIRVDDGSIQ